MPPEGTGSRRRWTFERLRARARELKTETYALLLASRDPRVPWYTKVLVGLVVAYALSPVDLIPDFIPVLGYVDDLLIVPFGVALAIKLVPDDVLAEHRENARCYFDADPPSSRLGAALIVLVWTVGATWLAFVLWRAFER